MAEEATKTTEARETEDGSILSDERVKEAFEQLYNTDDIDPDWKPEQDGDDDEQDDEESEIRRLIQQGEDELTKEKESGGANDKKDSQPEEKREPKKEEQDADAPDDADVKPDAAPKKVARKKPRQRIYDDAPPPAKEPAPAAPPPTPQAEQDLPPIEPEIDDDELDDVDAVAYAADNIGGKWGKEAGKWGDYLEKRAAKIAKLREDEPSFNPEEDPEFLEWVKSARPKMSAADRNAIAAHKIKSEVSGEIKKEMSSVNRRLREKETLPAIRKSIRMMSGDVIKNAAPKQVLDTLDKGGYQEAVKRYPLEARIIDENLQAMGEHLEEFHRIQSGLSDFDPAGNAKHAAIRKFMTDHAALARRSRQYGVKNGREFVDPLTYAGSSPADKARTYTWTPYEVVALIKGSTQNWIKQAITDLNENVLKAYRGGAEEAQTEPEKKGKEAPADESNIPPPPKEPPPPRKRLKPGPAAGKDAAGGKVPNYLEALGMSIED